MVMKTLVIAVGVVLLLSSSLLCQESWQLLQEYPSPGEGARGLYYDGKLLWNVDNESQTIFRLNPYNLVIFDTIPSPITSPWGLTRDSLHYWMTNFGGDASQLVRISTDTFLVDQSFNFDAWYFYGLAYDSLQNHLWISAMDHGYIKYLMEFDGDSGQVVAWHPWPYTWNLGLQYWNHALWTNTSDWNYPDLTYIYNLDSMTVDAQYICPMAVPEGIATNGVVWWISHFRDDAPYIWKLVPPGTELHDIAAHTPIMPPGSGILQELLITPSARFINYGGFPENDVPFVCRISESQGGGEIYYNRVVYPDGIAPEEIVTIEFNLALLQPNTDYYFVFYSDLPTDDYRNNDTLDFTVHTANVVAPDHDLAILSIVSPNPAIPMPPTFWPTIIVQNQGNVPEPVAPVNLTIINPDQSSSTLNSQVTQLAVDEIDTIVFGSFSPVDTGEYTFTFDGVLPLDSDPVNDLRSIEATYGVVHDVAAINVTSPNPLMPMAPFTPKVIIANLGDFNEPAFYSYCSISDSVGMVYNRQLLCAPINMGVYHELTFYSFNPPHPGLYRIYFETQLTNDQVPQNDSIAQTSSVGIIFDISPTTILYPTSTFSNEPIQPTVIVTNLGTEPSPACDIYCDIDSVDGEVLHLINEISPLNPDQVDTIYFSELTLNDPGVYHFKFTTHWEADMIASNDTIAVFSELVAMIFDISPTSVLIPTSTFSNEPLQPTAIVTNLGTEPSPACEVYCDIDSVNGGMLHLASTVQPLSPAGLDTIYFNDITLNISRVYRFRFITHWEADMIGSNDTMTVFSELPAGVNSGRDLVIDHFSVSGGFPNPFNSRTNFEIRLPISAEVKIELYRLDGCRVLSHSFGYYSSGIHQISLAMDNLPSGIYLAQIKADKWHQILKIALLK
jgi:hypothetical protein